VSAIAGRIPLRLPRLRAPRATAGITAIIVKELRGRMRGRRAFIVLTIHVLLLTLLAWMFLRLNEESLANQGGGFGGQSTYASAAVGRGIFIGLMMLQTLMVAVLAPAATAGAISSEREHQTLELLAVTPISSLAIVLGKLLSALAWLFVLILASIPVTALVFVFGGVAPDDMIRAYVVLFATVIGLGSVGIFFSTLTRRTGASTGLTFVVTLAVVVGSVFLWIFLSNTSEVSSTGLRRQPPEALLYLNPFVAQADVACGTEEGGFGNSCNIISGILGAPDQFGPITGPAPGQIQIDVNDKAGIPFIRGGGGASGPSMPVILKGGGIANDAVAAAVIDPFRDRFWPKSVLSYLVLAAVMIFLSVQFVTPTRRWRPSLLGPVRRRSRGRSA
jgi:ABC-type transport system involved in multi-copper enzyme maturation permease subunit